MDGSIHVEIACVSYDEGATATVDRGSPVDVECVAEVGIDTTLIMSLGHIGECFKIDGLDPESSG